MYVPSVEGRQIYQALIAVIALVGHHLVDHPGLVVGHRRGRFQVLSRRRQGLRDGRRVALVGALHRHADDGAGVQVDRVLGLVGQMRPAILHLRDAGLGVVRVPPLAVPALLRPLPIEPRQGRPRGRLDARGLRQLRQERLIRLPRIAPHDAPQRRVRLERRGIDPDRLPLAQLRRGQHLHDPREHRPMGLHGDQRRWCADSAR